MFKLWKICILHHPHFLGMVISLSSWTHRKGVDRNTWSLYLLLTYLRQSLGDCTQGSQSTTKWPSSATSFGCIQAYLCGNFKSNNKEATESPLVSIWGSCATCPFWWGHWLKLKNSWWKQWKVLKEVKTHWRGQHIQWKIWRERPLQIWQQFIRKS